MCLLKKTSLKQAPLCAQTTVMPSRRHSSGGRRRSVSPRNQGRARIVRNDPKRKAPKTSATSHAVGVRKRGNDGRVYTVDVRKNGVQFWRLAASKKKRLSGGIFVRSHYRRDRSRSRSRSRANARSPNKKKKKKSKAQGPRSRTKRMNHLSLPPVHPRLARLKERLAERGARIMGGTGAAGAASRNYFTIDDSLVGG